MSDRYCCVTWQELSTELSLGKTREIEKIIQEKGLPRSMFASIFKVLDHFTNYCPVCGGNINAKDVIKPSVQSIVATPILPRQVELATKRVTCPRCNGKKSFGKDDQGIVIQCMHCHGMGFIDQRHHVSEGKSEDELAMEKRIETFENGGNV